MANTVLNDILVEEKKAAELLKEAHQSANELVKNAESQATEAERKAAVENRALYQKLLEDRRNQVNASLQKDEGRQSDMDTISLSMSREKLQTAVDAIVEGVLNGHR